MESSETPSTTIVFVHGSGADGSAWEYQIEALSKDGQSPVAVELPGHGKMSGDLIDSIEGQADWLSTWLSENYGGPVALVGHSMGSLVAMVVAAQKPGQVSQLVLVGAAKTMPVHPALLESSAAGTEKCLELLDRWMHFNPDATQIREATRAGLVRNGFAALANDLAACNNFDSSQFLTAITSPTLVVSGAGDLMTTAAAGEALASQIGGAQFVSIEEAGHVMMAEQPESFNEVLTQFLTS